MCDGQLGLFLSDSPDRTGSSAEVNRGSVCCLEVSPIASKDQIQSISKYFSLSWRFPCLSLFAIGTFEQVAAGTC